MALIDWPSYFLLPHVRVWLWILAPLVVLYLIRPKPVNQTIPSLMFLMQDKAKGLANSFLRYIYRDLVFLLQMLIFILLVGAAARPYIVVDKTTFVGNAVIVLDASASMQTTDGRWDNAVKEAKAHLARQNTIILVLNRPLIIAKDVDRADAERTLDALTPTDTETNLYASIVASKDFVHGADTIVSVISDFRETDEQQDINAAIKAIRSLGAVVNPIQVGGVAKNVGIVSLDVKDEKTRIGVRNFNDEPASATVHAGTVAQTVSLAPQATDYVTITTPSGTLEVSLEGSDDFALDNHAFIANNPNLHVNILLITNDPAVKESALWLALQSINDKTTLDLTVDVLNPPTLKSPKEYDVVIYYKVNPQLIVQRTVRETAQAVSEGKAAIIMAQDGLFSINFEGMLPLTVVGQGGASAVSVGTFSPITKDVEFGDVQRYVIVNGTGRILAQAAADGSPIITEMASGKGLVLYYGIDDTAGSFAQEPYYPVFWKRVLDELGGRFSIDKLNTKTGSAALTASIPKKTPSKETFNGFYDKQGLYVFSDRTVASSLLSSAESQVSAKPFVESTSAATPRIDTRKNKELTSIVIIVILCLLFLELFIVKFRGDF